MRYTRATVQSPLDVLAVRAQFPAFERRVNGLPLAYLDSASTSQKPKPVIDAMANAMLATANIHRGVHTLSVEATEAFEAAREKAARFLGARDAREIVFVRGTTEAINLVAQTFGRANVGAGDEVIVTELEHHSNLVPWQALCAEKDALLRVLPIDDRGEVSLSRLDALLSPRTRLVAVAHVSNSLGTVLPVAEITRRAKAAGAAVLIDGAQAVPHTPVDVGAIGCDFYVFSAHKMYGPTGVGVLYGRLDRLMEMPPWQHGGAMIERVTFEQTTFQEPPYRFEAGTPDILGAIAFGAAIEWLSGLGMDRVAAREQSLLSYSLQALGAVRGVRLVGTPRERAAVVSFMLGDHHPHDVGTLLDLEGVAVRTGHHCAQPVMDHFGVPATVRASLGVYTTEEEIDRLAAALDRARGILGG